MRLAMYFATKRIERGQGGYTETLNLSYMAFLRYFKKVQLPDKFIRRKATGS